MNLRIGFDSFLQADLEAADALYGAALEMLEAAPRESIVDAFAGIGARRVVAGIAGSGARRLVGVACDPATLARDVRRLGTEWRLDRVRAFDLFPQTAHVETVLRLTRT